MSDSSWWQLLGSSQFHKKDWLGEAAGVEETEQRFCSFQPSSSMPVKYQSDSVKVMLCQRSKLLVLNNMRVALRVKAGPESRPCGPTHSSLHDVEEVWGAQAVRSRWEPSWAEPAWTWVSLPYLPCCSSCLHSPLPTSGLGLWALGSGLWPHCPCFCMGRQERQGRQGWQGSSLSGRELWGVRRSEGLNLIPIFHYTALMSNHSGLQPESWIYDFIFSRAG